MIHASIETITVGDLSKRIEERSVPVRRSTHIGNQPPRELAIMAGLPAGVEVLMVDTIQGSDTYTKPYQLHTQDGNRALRSRNSSEGFVVGSLVANQLTQHETRTLVEVHQQSLDALPLRNRPVPMMQCFKAYPHILGAVVASCQEEGVITRAVREDGKIVNEVAGVTAIFGGKETQGLLLPLNGMMAMDMLLSEEKGSDATLHLGGNDMVRYTQDHERMASAGSIFDRACALLGLRNRVHRYRIVPAKNLEATVRSQSQHVLLETGEHVDLEPFHAMVLEEGKP